MDELELTAELKKKAQQIITNLTQPLNDIVQNILNNTAGTELRLSMDELCALAIHIPAECAYLQSQLNGQIIEHELKSILTNNRVTQTAELLRESKGDARERQKRAEAMNQQEILANAVYEQVIAAVQATIQRADKVYEGIKKVIDAKSREANFDGKPGRTVL